MATPPQKLLPVPIPADWDRIHSRLAQARSLRSAIDTPEPPVPLILAGAAFSAAGAIRKRWSDLVEWSVTYGYLDLLLTNLPPAPDIDVADSIAGVSDDGRGWLPEWGEQNHPPKGRPPPDVVRATLSRLQERWPEVVGPALASSTRPIRLSGHKRRRIVVAADPSVAPPWGSWYSTQRYPQAFTQFRCAVNAAIAPMEVDEIDFSLDQWS